MKVYSDWERKWRPAGSLQGRNRWSPDEVTDYYGSNSAQIKQVEDGMTELTF